MLENLNCEIESCIVDERKKGANCDQAVVSIAKNCASSSDNCCVEKHISSDTGALPCTNWTKDYPTKKPTVFDRHEHWQNIFLLPGVAVLSEQANDWTTYYVCKIKTDKTKQKSISQESWRRKEHLMDTWKGKLLLFTSRCYLLIQKVPDIHCQGWVID